VAICCRAYPFILAGLFPAFGSPAMPHSGMSKSPTAKAASLTKLHAELRLALRPLAEAAAETERGAIFMDPVVAEEAFEILTETAVLAACISHQLIYRRATDNSGLTGRLGQAFINSGQAPGMAITQMVRGSQDWLYDAVQTIQHAGRIKSDWREIMAAKAPDTEIAAE
jgi:hypothetical protein